MTKEHIQHIVPFISASYSSIDFQSGGNHGDFTGMDAGYELGMKFASKPRMKTGKVRVPELQFSSVIADDVTGFKLGY